MDNLVFFCWHEVLPAENSDIIMFVEGENTPYVLCVGWEGQLFYAGTNEAFEVPENKNAVYCHCGALRFLASVNYYI